MTKQSTNTPHQSLHALIANDAYTMTFQSLPQYRTALLQRLAAFANQPEPIDWQAAHADMVKRNALLRARPDLPVDRIPAHAELVRLQEENARLRANQSAPTVPLAWRDALRRSGATDHHGRIAFLPAQLEHFASMLTAHQPAQERAEPTWSAVETVGDMVRNLLTLDQSAPVFTAFHVTIDGQRLCRATRGITISRERVVDGKWIDSTRKDVPYANVVWAKPDERAQQELVVAPQQAAAPCKHAKCTAYYAHVECLDCGRVKTDSGWGIASNQWFKSEEEAKFYRFNGRLPQVESAAQLPGGQGENA